MLAIGGAALRHPDQRLAEPRTHHDPTPRAEPLLPGSDSTEPCVDPIQKAGFVLGIIATLLLVLSILFIAFMIWFAIEYPEEFRRALEENY
jgi:hypothetical protein